MNLLFYLRYHTRYGESLWISGDIEEFGKNDPKKAVAMEYLNEESWQAVISIPAEKWPASGLRYKYYLKDAEGRIIAEWGRDRLACSGMKETEEIKLVDNWNNPGEYENVFFTAPFTNVLLSHGKPAPKPKDAGHYTHTFRIKAPLLDKNEIVCLTGSSDILGHWSEEKTIHLSKEKDWWTTSLDLSGSRYPVAYKYAVFNTRENSFVRYENGDNRLLHGDLAPQSVTILHDGFIRLPNTTWKGAGVAIPVFSLRSRNSFGIGEFNDIRLLVDWANATGLKLIQVLPINDTIATHSWMDSYPYAAISAFALHPVYINLERVAGKKHADKVDFLKKKKNQLNELAEVDYEDVIRTKLSVLKELYALMKKDCFDSEEYRQFFEKDKHWLIPYAAFCYFRDKYSTSHFESWPASPVYNKKEVEALAASDTQAANELGFYYFVQYHLHIQLKEAAGYAHKKGVILKGDIPIGIYRYGCDAWVAPELYNMNRQAGAPPDDFSVVGQNWGFPTYNWNKMQQDGFAWWRQRFEQMSNYFDAFRIDHILGFFRIWTIPFHAVQGIMGNFEPCIPVHYVEFGENGIWFDEHRYCNPFIIDDVLNEIFGDLAQKVKDEFLVPHANGGYDLKPEFDTQRKIEAHFAGKDNEADNARLRNGLFDLVSNVLFFKQEGSRGQEFHFRINMDKTSSYRYLIPHVQERLKSMYNNYFYRRQDEFWKKEALQKLPKLKEATNMLICGEDLGMVPHCVPEVMEMLGILSLEIQRMPKDPEKDFSYPDEAPYLSVVTPSTHDMSTIRGWWEENRSRTQYFYNKVLGQWGDAPVFCEAWINRAVVLQHIYSPAMWSIFQIQDLLGMSESLRRNNPHEERINNPASSQHYWRYRMHLNLEDLLNQHEFNSELKGYMEHSGR